MKTKQKEKEEEDPRQRQTLRHKKCGKWRRLRNNKFAIAFY